MDPLAILFRPLKCMRQSCTDVRMNTGLNKSIYLTLKMVSGFPSYYWLGIKFKIWKDPPSSSWNGENETEARIGSLALPGLWDLIKFTWALVLLMLLISVKLLTQFFISQKLLIIGNCQSGKFETCYSESVRTHVQIHLLSWGWMPRTAEHHAYCCKIFLIIVNVIFHLNTLFK